MQLKEFGLIQHWMKLEHDKVAKLANSGKKIKKTRPNSLIDTIASNNGYRQIMPYANLLTLLSQI